MRVGITCYPTYGGSGIVATELGLELADRGHEVHFITYSNPIRLDPGIPRITYHEVEVSTYPLFQYPPYCLALASRMMEVAEDYSLYLIHVSNFRPVKRVLDCIRILAEVRKNVPAHLLMVGDGPDRGAAEHLARDLNLARHVSFLGKQSHVERLIPLAHVLLMPSETESF